MKRILHITIALLLLAVAGQNAWATTKTVTYTLSREKVDHIDYFVLTHSGDTPFDGTTTVQHQQETGRTQATFQLPDGFSFTFDWKGGTVTSVSNSYFFCQNKNVQFSLIWNLTNKFVINVSVMDENGTPSTLSSSGTATRAFVYSNQGQVSFTLGTYAYFAKLVITYCDFLGEASGADGSAKQPYLISTPSDLNLLATNVNSGVSTYSGKHFLQTANLIYDGKENNYTAIGTSSHAFSGHYDGGEKTIRGINIKKTGTDTNADCYLGIFGNVDGGTIEKLALAGSTIVGYRYVGGIAGYLKGTVQNCRVENNVTVSTGGQNSGNQDFGGVVGRFESGTVQGCVCGASVISTSGSLSFCGGIVGSSSGTLRSNVYFGTSVYGINQRECGAILGSGKFSYNNYYTATSGVPRGRGTSSSNVDTPPHYEGVTNSNANASPAKLLTLGEHVAIDGDVVEYPFSGLTDLGGMVLRYKDGNSVRIFTHTWQTVTFRYDGEVPEGKSVAFRHCESNSVRPISGTAWTIKGSGNYSFFDTKDSFSIYAALVSDPVTITGKPAMGGYWATFYSSASYNLPEGTAAYTMDSNGQLHPLAANDHYGSLDGKKILGCVAVVLFSDKESITLDRINVKWDEDYLQYENILQGSDSPVPVVNGLVDGKTPYVLGVVTGVFGFHPFTGTEIPANKAYYVE
jgi:hypothetical protein